LAAEMIRLEARREGSSMVFWLSEESARHKAEELQGDGWTVTLLSLEDERSTEPVPHGPLN